METMITTIIILSIFLLYLLWEYLTLVFKTSYYEKTFEIYRDLFSKERYAQIESVKNKKSPF